MHGSLASFASRANNLSPQPITGRALAHNYYTPVERAFVAADLVGGRLQLIRPTRRQAVALAHSNPVYVKRAMEASPADREAILISGKPLTTINPIDPDLVELARQIGGDRWLAAAVAAGI